MFDFIHDILMHWTVLFLQFLSILYVLCLLCKGLIKILLFILKRLEKHLEQNQKTE